ncbi:MAG: hypothetical protein OIF38_12425, partial [Cellvibrionaceae bacterium]|nr:hypothetical protein [Cellvibrionaceae bacterium]
GKDDRPRPTYVGVDWWFKTLGGYDSVRETCGEEFGEPCPWDLERIWAEEEAEEAGGGAAEDSPEAEQVQPDPPSAPESPTPEPDDIPDVEGEDEGGEETVALNPPKPENPARNWIVIKAHGYKQCIVGCLNTRYSGAFEIVGPLSPLSLVGVGSSLIEPTVDSMTRPKINRLAWQDSYKSMSTANRQYLLLKWLRMTSNASLVVGTGAIGFQVGAGGYCGLWECVGD